MTGNVFGQTGLGQIDAQPIRRLSAGSMLLLTGCGVLLTALCAHVRVYVPWTIVPMTGQVNPPSVQRRS